MARLFLILETVYETVKRVTPLLKSTAPIKLTDLDLFLQALLTKLQEIQTAYKEFNQSVVNTAGDQTRTTILADIQSKFSYSIDVNTAKAGFLQACRQFGIEAMYKPTNIKVMVSDVIQIL